MREIKGDFLLILRKLGINQIVRSFLGKRHLQSQCSCPILYLTRVIGLLKQLGSSERYGKAERDLKVYVKWYPVPNHLAQTTAIASS